LLTTLYDWLEIPWIFRLSQVLLAPGKPWLFKRMFKHVFKPSWGSVLDVGCGPRLVTPKPEGLLVGVDVNAAHLRKYTGGFLDQDPRAVFSPPPSRRRLGFLASADHLPFDDDSFDEARATGFLHHLPHENAVEAIREMHRCLRKGGRLIVLEDVWPRRGWARPIAWLIRRLDRGAYMRTQEELLALFQEARPGNWEWRRFTYTFVGHELLYLSRVKQ
jgi:SAM-dependent methyltransferase